MCCSLCIVVVVSSLALFIMPDISSGMMDQPASLGLVGIFSRSCMIGAGHIPARILLCSHG